MVTMTHKRTKSAPKIALYEPDIPQNTAAIIRTCSCLGSDVEIIEPCGFLLSDKRFKRVVMDYMDEKKIRIFKNFEEFLNNKKTGRVILMTTKAKKSYTQFKYNNDDTLLFGRESAGVPEEIHTIIKHKLKIPMVEQKRSLNLSSTVSIILAESMRQLKLI